MIFSDRNQQRFSFYSIRQIETPEILSQVLRSLEETFAVSKVSGIVYDAKKFSERIFGAVPL